MKEINILKEMLVAGYLTEKCSIFVIGMLLGRNMPHHCVPCGVQSVNNESKINPFLMALCIARKVKFGIVRFLFTLRHGLNRDPVQCNSAFGKNA